MNKLIDDFQQNFLDESRWHYLTNGLKTTLIITFFAVILGFVLGFLVAIVRSTHDKTGKMKILNALCRVYLTVIRGTPMVVQLLITYFVIFGSVNIDKTLVAVPMISSLGFTAKRVICFKQRLGRDISSLSIFTI